MHGVNNFSALFQCCSAIRIIALLTHITRSETSFPPKEAPRESQHAQCEDFKLWPPGEVLKLVTLKLPNMKRMFCQPEWHTGMTRWWLGPSHHLGQIQKCWIWTVNVTIIGRKQAFMSYLSTNYEIILCLYTSYQVLVVTSLTNKVFAALRSTSFQLLCSGLSAEWILMVLSIPNVHHPY